MGANALRQAEQPSTLGRASVLILEDNEFQRVALTQVMRSLGVGSIKEAGGVDEALAMVAGSPEGFDICLCDLHLGEDEGVTFLQQAGMSRVRTFILISALDMTDMLVARRRALERGGRVAGVLTKPIRRQDLQTTLVKAMQVAERLN
jgi:CheY-like chemotaxis protein